MLEVAHIASGQGRARRVDDARAVNLYCSLCHRLHVSDSDAHSSIEIANRHFPTHDERHSMWVKQRMDPKNYDLDFLRTIWIGEPPQPEKPPAYYLEKLYENTGILG